MRLSALIVQIALLIAAWTIWSPSRPGLWLALAYVLTVWSVAEGIILWLYVAFSLAPFSDLLVASLRASAIAMWLPPGVLLLASHSQVAKYAGLVTVINCARLMASTRAPKWVKLPVKIVAAKDSKQPLHFRYQPKQTGYFSWEMVPTILGALALQIGVYALVGDFPLLAATSFAAVTGIWASISVARGAMDPRTRPRTPYVAPGVILTLLFAVTLTAVLIQTEVVREPPVEDPIAAEFPKSPGVTRRVLQRLMHLSPAPVEPAQVEAAPKPVVTRLADPTPAIGEKRRNGVPGVALRPRPKRSQRPALIVPGVQSRFSVEEPISIPFTGEYHLFRKSSGRLPAGVMVEPGTPLDRVYGTTNGGEMETVAIQSFDPPIDLTHCGLVLVVLMSAESMPVLASMQFVAGGRVEDGSVELMGMKQAGEETLEFEVPVVAKPLLVHTIRISFHRPGNDSDKNVRVAVERFTLVPRRRWQ